jgi:hypothetical protein
MGKRGGSYRILVGKPEVDYVEYPGEDRRIILKCFLKK